MKKTIYANDLSKYDDDIDEEPLSDTAKEERYWESDEDE